MPHSTLSISAVPVLSDNYAWIIHDSVLSAVVDPGEASPIIEFLQKKGLSVSTILVTHHHSDHCGGVRELKNLFNCQVVGPNDVRIPFVDDCVGDHDVRTIIGTPMRVLTTPGHTLTHVAYFFPEINALFTGDTLFSAGCGRLFEGSAEQMYWSLKKCVAVGDGVSVFAGHEYTMENLKFARTREPDNAEIQKRLDEVRILFSEGQPSLPTSILMEKAINPFLRTQVTSIRRRLAMAGASDIEVFAELRKQKNSF